MSAPSANQLYRAAQTLIRQGQPVFPVYASGPKAKTPLIKNWVEAATLDVDQAKRWWKQYGTKAAIGVTTGVLWDVLDVDVKRSEDGRVHLPRLHRAGLLNGCQRVVRTPSGGYHLYFRSSRGLTNKARGSLGLDVRAAGGYVLAPPSFIGTEEFEGAYETQEEPQGSTDDPLNWDLMQMLLAPIDVKTNREIELPEGGKDFHGIAGLRNWLSERKEGERNPSLYWAANRCIEGGIDPYDLVDVALMLGLGEEEIGKTIGSALTGAGVTADELVSEGTMLFG